jgi:transposase-like protein
MVLIPVRCPYCQSEQVIKGGKTDTGKQRYRCHNPSCSIPPTKAALPRSNSR